MLRKVEVQFVVFEEVPPGELDQFEGEGTVDSSQETASYEG